MIAFARRMLRDERARFLLVGIANTAIAYLLFVVLDAVLGGRYLLSLGLAYLVATIIAFVLHRRLTFGVTGRAGILLDFVRFESVYVVMLAVNAGLLALLIDVVGWPSFVAQAASIVVTTTISFVGHKFFSFRRVAAA